MTFQRWLLILTMVAGFAGCNATPSPGSNTQSSVVPDGGNFDGGAAAVQPAPYAFAASAASKVDSAGGTIESTAGAVVKIPPGALASSANIEVAVSKTLPIAAAPEQGFAGPAVRLTPHGITFNAPVAVRLPLGSSSVPAGATLRVFRFADENATKYEEIGGRVIDGSAVVLTNRFSVYVVGYDMPARRCSTCNSRPDYFKERFLTCMTDPSFEDVGSGGERERYCASWMGCAGSVDVGAPYGSVTYDAKCSNPCEPNPCLQGGQCFAEGSEFRCACPRGTSGQRCEKTQAAADPCAGVKCESAPVATCQNRQLRKATSTTGTCNLGLCSYTFTTQSCGAGECVADANGASCRCPAGYAGSDCSQCATGYQDNDQNGSCQPTCTTANVTCKNGGSCSDTSGQAQCACAEGYAGIDCSQCATGHQDNDKNGSCQPTCATAGLGCKNGGSCSDTSGQAQCVCAVGYAGSDCSQCATGHQDNDGNGTCQPTCATANLTCNGGGTCGDTTGTAQCVCISGYAGTNCQFSNAVTCTGNGTVSPSGACSCAPGYKGAQCQFGDATSCSGHGTVSDTGACTCNAGWSGASCSACASGHAGSNCQYSDAVTCNGRGTVNASGVCSCAATYGGIDCSQCATGHQDNDKNGSCQPTCATAGLGCKNGGSCTDTSGQAQCVCAVGYAGSDCSQCATGHQDNDGNGTCQPTCATANLTCNNGGACSDTTGTALCTCAGNFGGTSCDTCAAGWSGPSCKTMTPAMESAAGAYWAEHVSLALDANDDPVLGFGDGYLKTLNFRARKGGTWGNAYKPISGNYAGSMSTLLTSSGVGHAIADVSGAPVDFFWNGTTTDWDAKVLNVLSSPIRAGGVAHMGSNDQVHYLQLYYSSAAQTNFGVRYSSAPGGVWDAGTFVFTDGDARILDFSLDANNKVHAVVASQKDAGSGLAGYVSYLTNLSGTWTTEPIASLGVGNFTKSVSTRVDGNGAVHAFYTNNGAGTVNYATKTSGSWTSTIVAMVPSTAAADVGDVVVRVAKNGSLHGLYFDPAQNRAVYVAKPSTSWVSSTIDQQVTVAAWNPAAPLRHFDLAIDKKNMLHVVMANHKTGGYNTTGVDYFTFPAQVSQCGAGFQDNDGNGTCQATCATANLTCNNGGACSDTTGTALCTCAGNFGGTSCDTCAAGWSGPSCKTMTPAMESAAGAYWAEHVSLALDANDDPVLGFGDGYLKTLNFRARKGGTWGNAYKPISGNYAGSMSTLLTSSGVGHAIADVSGAPVDFFWNGTTTDWDAKVLNVLSSPIRAGGVAHMGSNDQVHYLQLYYSSAAQTNFGVRYSSAPGGVWDAGTFVFTDGDARILDFSLDANNKVHAVVASQKDAGSGLAGYVSYLTNLSGTWTTEPIASLGVGNFTKSVSTRVDGNGAVHAFYTNNGAGTVNYATKTSGSWTSTIVAMVPSTAAADVGDVVVRVAKNGSLHGLYFDPAQNRAVYVAKPSTSWVSSTIDQQVTVAAWNPAAPLRHFDLAIDKKNMLHVVMANHKTGGYNTTGVDYFKVSPLSGP